MCIRDRYIVNQLQCIAADKCFCGKGDGRKYFGEQGNHGIIPLCQHRNAVSYTHLDVYKRQPVRRVEETSSSPITR